MALHGLLGRKLGMTTVFTERGEAVPVTVVEAGPNIVTQIRTLDRDGYEAVQLGFGEVPQRKLSKPVQGQMKNNMWVRNLREMPADNVAEHTPGDVVDVDLFNTNDLVDVTGWSKGRGFQGVMRRHGFAGGPRTHGQSDRMRAPGSIGAGTSPGRVWKGKRMAGRMGNARKTVQRLRVVRVDSERHLLLIRGSVPGAKNGLVYVRRTVKPTK
ncbi:MAG TPA: 50S ribosomal protein L3 [Herpetosiphonaceae bacterium]|nr:50S ribosomal protein L3 [Herpetosiphonaceae bacterium]